MRCGDQLRYYSNYNYSYSVPPGWAVYDKIVNIKMV